MLRPKQLLIKTDIINNIENRVLFNVPTGEGKTYIISKSAVDIINDGIAKNVIICVPINSLVKDMYNTITKDVFDFNSDDVSIAIGKDNYLSIKYIKDNYTALCDYIEKESLDNYVMYAKDLDTLYFSDFDNIIVYKDIINKDIVHELIVERDTKKNIERFDATIVISNYFYVLSKVLNNELDFSDTVFLFDEVHTIIDVAEAILEEQFSPFELGKSLKSLEIRLSELSNTSSLIQYMKTLRVKIAKSHNKFCSLSHVGMLVSDKHLVESFSKEINSILNASYSVKIIEQLNKIVSNKEIEPIILNPSLYALAIIKKGLILSGLNIADSKLSIYYSPSKGYPTLKRGSSNIEVLLKYKFWNKIERFAGLSATVSYQPVPFGREADYGYIRLGLYEKGKEHKVFAYDKTFDKTKINIFIPDDIPEKENIYNEQGKIIVDIKEVKYYRYVANFIYDNYENKNSVVICGGYAEATYLSDLFSKYYPDILTHCSSRSINTFAQIEKFKRTGGILFATRNYNTGINLEEKSMEKLFLLNFPYPIFTSLRWAYQRMKSKSYSHFNMNKEMLISLMQTLGRMQRTKYDVGDIYILDNKYFSMKHDFKKDIDNILEYYGVFKKVRVVADTAKGSSLIKRKKVNKESSSLLDSLLDGL
ncbi:MAG: hypothetical protein DRI86_00945 [Bacteroidetes bacterium]|nr:MAG: hypothetical protein DRI86_00945 [Bacteroidota bacterium]